jgi:hypothetical protein
MWHALGLSDAIRWLKVCRIKGCGTLFYNHLIKSKGARLRIGAEVFLFETACCRKQLFQIYGHPKYYFNLLPIKYQPVFSLMNSVRKRISLAPYMTPCV